jgi:hypothetical protein
LQVKAGVRRTSWSKGEGYGASSVVASARRAS